MKYKVQSVVYCHLNDTGYVLDSKAVKILDKERGWQRRGIKEAIWERVESLTLNRKGGGGSSARCHTLGTGPSTPFLNVCHMTANCYVTKFTDEDRWFWSKHLLSKLRFKIPEIDLFIYLY